MADVFRRPPRLRCPTCRMEMTPHSIDGRPCRAGCGWFECRPCELVTNGRFTLRINGKYP